jgi:hypothetical protein
MKKCFILGLILFLFVVYLYAQDNRGLEISIKELGLKQNVIGKQYVVLIAIDKYEKWFPLKNPVKDAKEIKHILTSLYYIDEVIELYDREATKANIIKLFEKLVSKLKIMDSLLIFYAGHGYLDEITDTGFWIPVNAGTDVYAQDNWLPNVQIRGLISKLKASHVCLIADACFSGDILNSTRGISPTINNEYFKKAYERTSRQVLTSGASETVPDRSEFCRLLKMALEKNKNPYLDPVMLYNEIRLGLKKTLPMIGNLKETGHQDGASFILFLRMEKEIAEEDKATTTATVTEAQEKQAQEKLFKVSSQKPWQYTGIEIFKGDHIIIEYVSGTWTNWGGGKGVDARGYTSEVRSGDFTPASLIGRIGDDNPFEVGNYCEIKEADKTGRLYVRINEIDGQLHDNIGSIKIQIMVNVVKESAEKIEDSFTFLTEYAGHKYYISKHINTWYWADEVCKKTGGHLVTITSAEENQTIIAALRANDISANAWIGYVEKSGSWSWITDEKSDFNFWEKGEPNNDRGRQHWAHIWQGHVYKWADAERDQFFYFILEVEP